MKNKFFIIALFFLLCVGSKSFGKDIVIIKFNVISNKIVLKVRTSTNLELNILFDTGSNDFILDSALAQKLELINSTSPKFAANFLNGSVRTILFANKRIFQDTILNHLYTRGNCFNLGKMSSIYAIHIDGILGINALYKNYVVGLDFKNCLLTIGDGAVKIAENEPFIKLKMIYTDGGHEVNQNSAFHQLSACRIKLILSENCHLETNVMFDTGFNNSFAMLTTLNADSIVRSLKKPYTLIPAKLTGAGALKYNQYSFSADSVIIDDRIKLTAAKIYSSNVSGVSVSAYGSLNTFCLAGVEFLKQYNQVYFDYRSMNIILYKDGK